MTDPTFNAGFVTGLAAEAALLEPYDVPCRAGGGGVTGAHDAAVKLCNLGVTALISFGLAGGLDPLLAPGTILRPRGVSSAGSQFAVDPELLDAFGGANCETVLAGERVVCSAAEKSSLFTASGASAIDLESGAVARVATNAGLPFAVLRAIADPAWVSLPNIVESALDSTGRIRFGVILRHAIRSPRDVSAFVALGRNAAAARKNLRGALKRCDWKRLRAD